LLIKKISLLSFIPLVNQDIVFRISNFRYWVIPVFCHAEHFCMRLTIPVKSISILVHCFCYALWYLLKHCPGKIAPDCIILNIRFSKSRQICSFQYLEFRISDIESRISNVYFRMILLRFRTICFPKMNWIVFRWAIKCRLTYNCTSNYNNVNDLQV
jgi:hypothetical protein